MPPQQPDRLLDLFDDGFSLGAHSLDSNARVAGRFNRRSANPQY
jgi:hypothetical protein